MRSKSIKLKFPEKNRMVHGVKTFFLDLKLTHRLVEIYLYS